MAIEDQDIHSQNYVFHAVSGKDHGWKTRISTARTLSFFLWQVGTIIWLQKTRISTARTMSFMLCQVRTMAGRPGYQQPELCLSFCGRQGPSYGYRRLGYPQPELCLSCCVRQGPWLEDQDINSQNFVFLSVAGRDHGWGTRVNSQNSVRLLCCVRQEPQGCQTYVILTTLSFIMCQLEIIWFAGQGLFHALGCNTSSRSGLRLQFFFHRTNL